MGMVLEIPPATPLEIHIVANIATAAAAMITAVAQPSFRGPGHFTLTYVS